MVEMLTMKEALKSYGVSQRTLYNARQSGRVKDYEIDGKLHFNASDLDKTFDTKRKAEALKSKRNESKPRTNSGPRTDTATHLATAIITGWHNRFELPNIASIKLSLIICAKMITEHENGLIKKSIKDMAVELGISESSASSAIKNLYHLGTCTKTLAGIQLNPIIWNIGHGEDYNASASSYHNAGGIPLSES